MPLFTKRMKAYAGLRMGRDGRGINPALREGYLSKKTAPIRPDGLATSTIVTKPGAWTFDPSRVGIPGANGGGRPPAYLLKKAVALRPDGLDTLT